MMNFSAVGGTIQQTSRIENLSGRDQVELFRLLGEKLGIWDAFHEYPDATEKAQALITRQWDLHWSRPCKG